MEFYKSAFAANVVYRIDGTDGAVVARLSIDGAEFWVADESLEHKNFSPETLGARERIASSGFEEGLAWQAFACWAAVYQPHGMALKINAAKAFL